MDGTYDEAGKLKILVRVKVRKHFYGEDDNSHNHDAEKGSPKWKVVLPWYKKTKYSYFR